VLDGDTDTWDAVGFLIASPLIMTHAGLFVLHNSYFSSCSAVRSESRCALRLRCVDLVVSIEVAVEVCCCFTVFRC
jgi:hypothetical protein